MGPRNLLILFFSTVAVSLVILIIFFSLFFKNFDLNFNTRLPESAPDPLVPDTGGGSRSSGVLRSTVNVPPEYSGGGGEGVVSGSSQAPGDGEAKPDEDEEPVAGTDIKPVTNDVVLEQDPAVEPPPAPKPELRRPTPHMPPPPPSPKPEETLGPPIPPVDQ